MSVPRAPLPHLVALVLGVGAAVAVGCGDRSNLIPAGKADSLTAQLSDLKSRIAQGDCDGITDDVRKFRSAVISLSTNNVDSSLRRRLREGADSLLDHAANDCTQVRDAQTQTETTDTDTTETETDTTPTDTVTTTKTETQTTETQTQTTQTQEQPTDGAPPSTATPGGTDDGTPGNGNGGVVPPDDGTGTP